MCKKKEGEVEGEGGSVKVAGPWGEVKEDLRTKIKPSGLVPCRSLEMLERATLESMGQRQIGVR